MIYLESFRHFVQEWIRIQPPKDKEKEWPWARSLPLWLLNLYAIPGDDPESERRSPFISLLIDGCSTPNYALGDSDPHIYSEYFSKDETFQYPRRFILDPFGMGRSNMHLSRFSFHGNFYKMDDKQYGLADRAVLTKLAQCPHARYSIYDSHAYMLLLDRLKAMEQAAYAHTGKEVPIRYAENLLDTTVAARVIASGHMSPDTMILQVPINGIIPQIKKSHTYRILNGALVLPREPVVTALPGEPCAAEYRKLANPLASTHEKTVYGQSTVSSVSKGVVYLAVEVPSSAFSFIESFGNILFTEKQERHDVPPKSFAYMVTHQFNLIPSTTSPNPSFLYGKLKHNIIEGVIQNDKRHARFIQKENATLFKRSDLPRGFHKNKGGNSVSVNVPIT